MERGHGLPGKYREIAHAYHVAGFKEKAYYYAKEALMLDDDSAAHYMILAEIEDAFGNFKKAIELEERSYSFDSTNLWTVLLLGVHYSYLGQTETYLEYMKKFDKILKTLDIPWPWGTFRIGHAYWVNGFKEDAKPYLNTTLEFHEEMIELDRHYGKDIHTFYNLAAFNAFLGNKEKAFEYLRRFNQRQIMPKWAVKDLKNDPLFDNIRDEAEFQQIVNDVEAKYQAEHERIRVWLDENAII